MIDDDVEGHPNAPDFDDDELAPPHEPPGRVTRRSGAGVVELPEIVISTDMEHIVNQAESALLRCQRVFTNARRLVHVVRDPGPPPDHEDDRKIRREAGTPLAAPLKTRAIQELCGSAATWLRWKVTRKTEELVPAMVPAWVAETLMQRDQWKLPQLDGISDSPVFRRDGTVHSEPGYDPRSRVLFDPRGVIFPRVPDQPTPGDAGDALAELLEPFVDFPFVDGSSRTAVAAVIMTIIARSAIRGVTPMFPINATKGGTGKGLLGNLVGIIATGKIPAMTTHTHDEEELRKRLMASAMEATSVVNIDNVSGSLGSGVLDAVITAGELTDRVLGLSENRTVPIRFVLMATGNQIQYRADTGRRIVPIDLNAQVERPEDRSGWQHDDVKEYVRAERPRLVVAALTVLRAFAVAGRPRHGLAPMGGFEEWDELVRGAIIFAGGADPVAGTARIREEGDDEEGEKLRALITTWHLVYGGLEKTIADIVATVTKSDDPAHGALRDALASYCRHGKIDNGQIGQALKRSKGRVIGELFLEPAGITDGSRRWKLARVSGEGASGAKGAGKQTS